MAVRAAAQWKQASGGGSGFLVRAAVYQDDPDLARCVWAEAAPWVASVSARAGEVFEQAEDTALAFTAFPKAHWPKLRTNNVQERANREIKRRYSMSRRTGWGFAAGAIYSRAWISAQAIIKIIGFTQGRLPNAGDVSPAFFLFRRAVRELSIIWL